MSERPTVFVTGGAGYIGSHACKALAGQGYRPVVYDDLSRGHRDSVRWGPLVEGDVLDTAALERALREARPAAVMHFAAFAYVGESMARPEIYYRNNVQGTWSLLAAMRRAGVRDLVFSSSCATYGGVHSRPITEATPQAPDSTYGFTKLVAERMIADETRAHGLRATALRYFNAAGADPEGELREDHDPEPHFIPNVLKTAAGAAGPLTINGDDHPTADGTCVRDFVHVQDLARGHVLALDALLAGNAPAAVNFGTGSGFSLLQIVKLAEEVTGRPVPYDFAPARPGDPPYAVADYELARRTLGWEPELADIRLMIEHAWRTLPRLTSD
ncbi:UDP-glucose 4-epimerase [Salinisphaera sp. PC39]|uniref:UDP-glucose 4-epimerase GalE n=1 Tax=Salinisphaera sp. PC39 TaxID=1304156 RepID=UPI003340A5BE